MQFKTDKNGDLYPVANKLETNPAIATVQKFLDPLAKVPTGYQEVAKKAKDAMEALLNGLRPFWRKELARGPEAPTAPLDEEG